MNLQKRLAKCKYYLYNDSKFVNLIDREPSYEKDHANFQKYYGDIFFSLGESKDFTRGVTGRLTEEYAENKEFFILGRKYYNSRNKND